MNINGTYKSQDGAFTLTIANANEGHGTFGGSYVSTYTPQGQQTFSVFAGIWNYVGNPAITQNSIAFIANIRPNNWPYCIQDSWSGVMTQQGQILLTGVRSYLSANGTYVLSSLGTMPFSAQ
ncbi:hypothetical protein [Burkholderia oklahomensis]|uniref:Uncharacterized protein n=1 Tax=Burkholderia oklahomensis TaxID=342113 RepID=A0AAI8BA32_9BURK|nr:hypothetical protein [Burkholderia oklahomensis]AIO68316.1 hypothetical protein DM82_2227 [Burkholderia oklahomensis]AJX30460.1 hypothetical protein BG90_2485 [Burkholderia oklahomensis C6786]AOI41605.1 hypothetical protein WG70_18125 [Burkholderia oklahomensis EO147]AOI45192.1 hypothetical protein WI23_04880 [Burkholderia oklahomensis C6786]KUY59495.1 hypothetical protein WI23_15665 [Burkholderia oklahomensis C6786]